MDLETVFRLLHHNLPDHRSAMLMEIGMLLQADIPDPERQYQWLTTEIPAFGQKPIDMLGDDGGVAKLQGFLMVMGQGGTF